MRRLRRRRGPCSGPWMPRHLPRPLPRMRTERSRGRTTKQGVSAMEIRITDADGFGRLSPKADLAVVVITRADIEALRVGSTVERLLLFSDDATQVLRFAGRMVIQVEGYDDDPRPLVLIPECVRFFRAVDAQWSYWLHFLLPLCDQLPDARARTAGPRAPPAVPCDEHPARDLRRAGRTQRSDDRGAGGGVGLTGLTCDQSSCAKSVPSSCATGSGDTGRASRGRVASKVGCCRPRSRS